MNKNFTYRNKLAYEGNNKKDDTLKIELVISSNHNLSDDMLNNINHQFKNFSLFGYKIQDVKPSK
jgi:hypothetical protein